MAGRDSGVGRVCSPVMAGHQPWREGPEGDIYVEEAAWGGQ